MRLKALVTGHPTYRKAIIFSAHPAAVYLFLYETIDDAPCRADYWFTSVGDAQEWAGDELGIDPAAWWEIADPLPGQHDDREGSPTAPGTRQEMR